jgi:hypothetical protein
VHSESARNVVGGAIGVEGVVREDVSPREVFGLRARSGGETEDGPTRGAVKID